MPQRILALEIEAQELKAAVVETTFRDYKVVGFYRDAISPDGGSLAEQLRAFVQRHHLASTTVLTSLPGDLVTLRTFFLPFRDRKRLDQTVPFELENQVPFGLEEVVVDYHVLHTDKAGSNILAVLVQRKDLEAHLATLAEAGLDPKVVDLAPLATLNILKLLSDLPETFVYIGGLPQRLIVALYRNRQLVGLRTLLVAQPASETETTAAAAGNGHPVHHSERVAAMVREIRWTLLALNGAPLDAAIPCLIAGEGVEFDQLGQELMVAADVRVHRLDPAAVRNLPPPLRPELSGFAASLGLALREVAPTDALGVNFRRGEFAYHRGQDEVRRALWRTGTLAAVVVVLMITNTYMGYQQLTRRLELVQSEIRNVFTQTLPDVHRIVDEKTQLQSEIDAAQKKLQVLGGVAPMGGATAVDTLRTLSAAIPDGTKVDIDEYVMDPEGVRIKAKAESFEAADAIQQQIANTHAFGDVQVKDVKAAPDGKGVDFRLVVVLSKEGPVGKATR